MLREIDVEVIKDEELLEEFLNEIVILYFSGIDVKEALKQVKENLKN
ncbi:hypothetical protein [Sarcina ventriculi]|nr:hypothetical protein [Sarcina ventriculi]